MAVHIATVILTAFMLYTAWPGSSLFSWHPTCMTLAFMFCMFQGLMTFNRESSLFLTASRTTKVLVHQWLNIAAVAFSLIGFAVIYYNKEINEKPHFTSWHGLFGVTTVVLVTIQSFGGDIVKYQWLRSVLRIQKSLGALKIYHATSGLIVFTMVCITLLLSFFSTWFVDEVNEIMWYVCYGGVACMAMIVMNQIVQEYLPRTRPQQAPVAKKAYGTTGSKKKR